MNYSREDQLKELERHFPELRQKLDLRVVEVIGRLASQFRGDRERDMAVLRATIESLYKARTSEALLRNIDHEIDYTLQLVDYARMNHVEMKRLFR
jgi:hypothetical protein